MTSFEEFWPFYLREHSRPMTRAFHFAGTTIALVVAASAIAVGEPWWMFSALVPGYGFAWVSHFFIEKNRPATFKHPLWSFMGDWKMWALMLSGRIQGEVERHAINPRAHSTTSA
jgi:hypothetical protein